MKAKSPNCHLDLIKLPNRHTSSEHSVLLSDLSRTILRKAKTHFQQQGAPHTKPAVGAPAVKPLPIKPLPIPSICRMFNSFLVLL